MPLNLRVTSTTLGQVYTYDGEYPDASREFDMQVTSVVASNDKDERRHLSFDFEGKRYNIDVTYDRGRVKFFSTYPQLNLDMYFGSDVYKVTATPLQKQLAAHMQGMSEQQAVNFLLRFVQTSLKYQTDEGQFGEGELPVPGGDTSFILIQIVKIGRYFLPGWFRAC